MRSNWLAHIIMTTTKTTTLVRYTKTLHQHPETIWNKFDVCARCGVYDYKLSSYAHHHTKSDWSKLTEKNNRINTYIYERGQKSKANPNDNILCTLFMYVEKKKNIWRFFHFQDTNCTGHVDEASEWETERSAYCISTKQNINKDCNYTHGCFLEHT